VVRRIGADIELLGTFRIDRRPRQRRTPVLGVDRRGEEKEGG
jgi:hypothetical protein